MRTIVMLITALISVSFAQNGSLSGLVLGDKQPLPAAKIEYRQGGEGPMQAVMSGMDGTFRIGGLAGAEYELSITYPGFKQYSQRVRVGAHPLDLGVIRLGQEKVQELQRMKIAGSMQLNQVRAQMIQQNADQIKSVIASDRIGKLPDRNAAEAVQRVSGVSIERDQGEGRFVAVRGMPREWNSATLNGNRIPGAEEEDLTRAAAFDFFPTDLIEYVEVAKALTPEMEMDALGGSVNYVVKSAPNEPLFNVALSGGGGAKSQKPAGAANVLVGNRFADGKVGVLLNGSYWLRNWATDNWENRTDGLGIYRLELRDYTGVRQTWGLNVALDYKPAVNHKLYALGMYGSLNDDELHYKHRLRYDKIGTFASYDTATGFGSGSGRVEIQNIHNILITRFIGGELGGEHRLSDMLKLDWKGAIFNNKFYYGDVPTEEDNSYYALKYRDKSVNFSGLRYANNQPADKMTYAFFEVDGGRMSGDAPKTHLQNTSGVMYDEADVSFGDAGIYRVEKSEQDVVGQLDVTFDPLDNLQLKAGGKYRLKNREELFTDEYWYFKAGESAPKWTSLELVDQPGKDDYLAEIGGIDGVFGKVIDVEALDAWWKENKSKMYCDSLESALTVNGQANGRTYELTEQQHAGYVQAKFEPSKTLSLLGGLRMERTRAKITAPQTTIPGTDSLVDWTSFYAALATNPAADTTWFRYSVTDRTDDNTYYALLPALHLTYTPLERTKLRLALSRSFARPGFKAINPGLSIMSYDNAIEAGNPDLNPTYSMNFDAMAEHYFRGVGYVQLGGFYKLISDPIFASSRDTSINGAAWDFSTFDNGEDAWLAGFEVGASKTLDFLGESFMSGFGLEANYTFMLSEMIIPTSDAKNNSVKTRTTRIPRQADHLFNAALFYEYGGFNARLALNYKGDYITEHAGSKNYEVKDQAGEYLDEYFGDYLSMDLSASYGLNKRITLFAEFNNLLNTPMVFFMGEPDKQRQIQTEYYGVRGLAGVKVALF